MKSLLDLFGPAAKLAVSSKLLILLASPTGLNPCYRRESGRTPGNLLKLGGMDSAVRHFQEPSEPLIGRLLEQRSEVLWSQFNGTRTSDNSRISP